MKILQILPELNVGGVETGTIDLARYLTEHGHEAVVVSHGGALVPELKSAGAKHYTLPVHQKNLLTMFWSMKRLQRIIIQEKVDIVHARSRVPAWVAYFACRKTGVPFITTCHGYYSKHFFSVVMGWAKLIIVPSRVIGHHMVEDFGVPLESIRCIPRSVDIRKFNIPRDEDPKRHPVIAIVGRITPLKGHEYFLRAMARVVRQMPYVKVWVIGDAPLEKESYKEGLLSLTKQLGLVNCVEFLGNRKDIPQLLSRVDVLVLSTVTQESFGRVILEAQAAGVPVVATRVGGVVDIIEEGETGLLVAPRQPDEMAQAILRILNDTSLSKAIVANAKKKLLEEYTLDHMASQTLAVYQELLQTVHLLVIKLSAIGDALLITPSLKALREKFPFARISCLVGPSIRELLQRCPYVDEIIVYDPKGKHRGKLGLWRLGRTLRKHHFDKVIDLQNNRKSHLLAFLSFCPERYGYKNKKWGFLLSRGIKDDQGILPAIPHQFRVLKQVGISMEEDVKLEVWPSPQDYRYVRELLEGYWLAKGVAVVGINVSASTRWPSKNWPKEHIAKLCDLLAAKNIRVVLTGLKIDQPAAQAIIKLTKAKPIDLTGKTTVLQMASLIQQCSAFVVSDSAPMHLAAAVSTPFVALFGPTDPFRHLPPAKKYKVIALKPHCAPCYQGYCPIKTHACMANISPQAVLQEIESLIEKKQEI